MRPETQKSIPAALRHAASAFPETAAVIDGMRRLSFRELDAEVDRAASGFVAAGLARGDAIAIWAPNSLEWITACLGAQAAGGVVVPLNTRLKGREAQFALNRSRARILVMAGKFLNIDFVGVLEGLDLPNLKRRIVIDGGGWESFLSVGDARAAEEARDRRMALTANDLSDILFTSGTTGEPKGVVCAHGQTVRVAQLWGEAVGLRHDDRYLIVNPFFHSFGYKAGFLACIEAGATIYPQARLDVPEIIRRIASERITVLPGPPTLFHSLLARPADPDADLSSLRLAVTGAASVPPALIERMRTDLGIETVLTGYGLTESSGLVTLSKAGDSAELVATRCGRAVPGVELRCVNPAGRDMPTDEEGEVVVRGFNVMQGYFEDAVATSAAIDENGWLHTGDIGRLDEAGYLQITDRMKDMYISGGFNCYPAEVERIIAGHPDVGLVAVIGVADERMGEVGKAFIVPRPGCDLEANDMIAWCRDAMANYKAPRHVQICETLPTNASGKVVKSELRQPPNQLN